jgi:hypothetical protein
MHSCTNIEATYAQQNEYPHAGAARRRLCTKRTARLKTSQDNLAAQAVQFLYSIAAHVHSCIIIIIKLPN